MTRKPYSEQLKDPRWQRKRLEILSRAEFSCENCCDDESTLHVHHKLYRKGAMPWEYEAHELQALCESCHEAEHAVKQALQAAMAEMSLWHLEQLLGFAEGKLAKHYVYASLEEDGPAIDESRRWPLKSKPHAQGFLTALWSLFHPAQVEIAMKHSPLGCEDVRFLKDGPSRIAIEATK